MRGIVGATCALACALALAQGKPTPAEREANCRKASEMAVEQLRRTPAAEGRDRRDKEALLKKTRDLIDENRRKGVDECTTWGQVMGLAFTN